MKAENCAEITDAKRIELKTGLTEPVKNDRYSGFIVPAGILIGVGVGLLVDYLVSGFLVGLGFGLIGSELFRLVEKSREAEWTQPGGANVTTLLSDPSWSSSGSVLSLRRPQSGRMPLQDF